MFSHAPTMCSSLMEKCNVSTLENKNLTFVEKCNVSTLENKNLTFVEKCNVLTLVTELEKHPCLYDFTLPDHTDRGKIAAAWEEISNLLGCPVRDCKEKWRKIRIAFGRFLKLSKSDTPPTRAYYLSDHLQFLVPFVKTNGAASPGDPKIEVLNYETVKDEFVSDEEEMQILNYKYEEEYDETNDSYVKAKEEFTPKRPQKRDYNMIENNTDEMSPSPRKMFLLSLLPDVESLSEEEMRKFRMRTIIAIDDIINARERNTENVTTQMIN